MVVSVKLGVESVSFGCDNLTAWSSLISLTKNLWYQQHEQLDTGGGGALSQGAGHDEGFYGYAV